MNGIERLMTAEERRVTAVHDRIYSHEWELGPDDVPFLRELSERERLERIDYDLGACYIGHNYEVRAQIAAVISKLPRKAGAYALARCIYISVGVGESAFVMPGRVLPRQARRKWLVVLSDRMPAKSSQSIVAHEIAHAWLKHDLFVEAGRGNACEREAAAQARRWGFRGQGAWARRKLWSKRP